jgi:hypothetical protein
MHRESPGTDPSEVMARNDGLVVFRRAEKAEKTELDIRGFAAYNDQTRQSSGGA